MIEVEQVPGTGHRFSLRDDPFMSMSIRVACVLSLWLATALDCRGATRPNVVVFLADDAGWGDYGHSGNRQVATPNIDAIAQAGVSLDRFYVCPVCAQPAPSSSPAGIIRAAVCAASPPGKNGSTRRKTPWRRRSRRRVTPPARSGNGITGANGPIIHTHGFDEYFGYTSGHWGEYNDPPLEDNGRMTRARGYIVDICTDRALQFIDKNHDRPFFCYVPFTTPHSPWSVPDADWRRSESSPPATRKPRRPGKTRRNPMRARDDGEPGSQCRPRARETR